MSHPFPGAVDVDLPRAFRPAASSVWVVSTDHHGHPVGFTAISVVSVSVLPPVVSFNIGRTSSSLAALRGSGRWSAHLLHEDSEDVARRFSGPADLRFAEPGSWHRGPDGTPVVHGWLTRIHGTVSTLVPAGDSLVVLGAVEGVDTREGEPLVHHDRSYRSVGSPLEAAVR